MLPDANELDATVEELTSSSVRDFEAAAFVTPGICTQHRRMRGDLVRMDHSRWRSQRYYSWLPP